MLSLPKHLYRTVRNTNQERCFGKLSMTFYL
jgi:hypothetical protein